MPIKPEIMSPVGYWPQLHAAIEAGADAAYFGLRHFTARAKVGFTLDELPEVMRTLHSRGVKGYVTFNTLIFDHELREAVKTIEQIAVTGADSLPRTYPSNPAVSAAITATFTGMLTAGFAVICHAIAATPATATPPSTM